MKEIFEKIKVYPGIVWRWLSGKKRRIAIISLMLSKILPAHSKASLLTKYVSGYCEYLFYLFGSTDIAEVAIKKSKCFLMERKIKNDQRRKKT
ncbi:MAG: hypothetical protein AB1521_16800 [Bacteroidota bacterium]